MFSKGNSTVYFFFYKAKSNFTNSLPQKIRKFNLRGDGGIIVTLTFDFPCAVLKRELRS